MLPSNISEQSIQTLKKSSPNNDADDKPDVSKRTSPVILTHQETLDWVSRVLVRSPGKEPIGNYNPLVIGEFFWELSSPWEDLAKAHMTEWHIFANSLLTRFLERNARKM
jgi:hypothetical protein